MGLDGLDSLQRKLRDIKDDVPDAANDAVSDTLDDTERRAKRNIVEQDAVQTTEMYRSFVKTRTSISGTSTRHRLTNVAPHAQLQEYGTGQQFATSQWVGVFPPQTQRFDAPSFSMVLVAVHRG